MGFVAAMVWRPGARLRLIASINGVPGSACPVRAIASWRLGVASRAGLALEGEGNGSPEAMRRCLVGDGDGDVEAGCFGSAEGDGPPLLGSLRELVQVRRLNVLPGLLGVNELLDVGMVRGSLSGLRGDGRQEATAGNRVEDVGEADGAGGVGLELADRSPRGRRVLKSGRSPPPFPGIAWPRLPRPGSLDGAFAVPSCR